MYNSFGNSDFENSNLYQVTPLLEVYSNYIPRCCEHGPRDRLLTQVKGYLKPHDRISQARQGSRRSSQHASESTLEAQFRLEIQVYTSVQSKSAQV